MSLWFRTRDKDGTVHHVSIPFEPLAFIALVGIIVALMFPLLHMFRTAVVASPVYISVVIACILLVGATLFVFAKMSVIRAGRLVSFGPRLMSPTMRFFYIIGYVLLVIGTVGALLFALAASVAS